MIQALFSGIVFGFALLLMVGPVFFMVVETSINKGFVTACYFLGGVYISDVIYVIITNLGVSKLVTDNLKDVYWIGGAILLLFGLILFFKKSTISHDTVVVKKSTHYMFFLKGFIVNTTAPGVILIWTANAIAVTRFSIEQKFIYFLAVFAVALSADIAKAYYAMKLKSFITTTLLNKVNKISGLVLAIFGLYMWVKGYLMM